MVLFLLELKEMSSTPLSFIERGVYNLYVPTPFYHMSLAEELLKQSELINAIRQKLETYRCAFLLGNTVPDVQVFSGQKREETHFFTLPILKGAHLAWKVFLKRYPELAEVNKLPQEQAVFVAGYLCHLLADWYWMKEIYLPVFGPTCLWGTFRERLHLHNVLRTQLDLHALATLSPGLGVCLAKVQPEGWLPFIEDKYVLEWRDFLASQLKPGVQPKTVDVFSERGRTSPEAFYDLLNSEERMEKEVFVHLPRSRLEKTRQKALKESGQLLLKYWANSANEGIL